MILNMGICQAYQLDEFFTFMTVLCWLKKNFYFQFMGFCSPYNWQFKKIIYIIQFPIPLLFFFYLFHQFLKREQLQKVSARQVQSAEGNPQGKLVQRFLSPIVYAWHGNLFIKCLLFPSSCALTFFLLNSQILTGSSQLRMSKSPDNPFASSVFVGLLQYEVNFSLVNLSCANLTSHRTQKSRMKRFSFPIVQSLAILVLRNHGYLVLFVTAFLGKSVIFDHSQFSCTLFSFLLDLIFIARIQFLIYICHPPQKKRVIF